jgi:hypothetical protein
MLPTSTTGRLAGQVRRERNRRQRPAPGANSATTTARVLDAIRAHGTRNFTGADIAREAGLCRPTVYKIIMKLNGQGHRIEGERRLGFMARLREATGHCRSGARSEALRPSDKSGSESADKSHSEQREEPWTQRARHADQPAVVPVGASETGPAKFATQS